MKALRRQGRIGFGVRISEFLYVAFIMSLPKMTKNFASLQENNDKLISKFKPEYILNQEEEFDYVIVGGGSAGSVLTNRLSKSPRNKVLLLELGGDPNPFEDIPALYSAFYGLEPIYHLYKTEMRDDVCLNNNGVCIIPAGRGLGGGSAVNGMIYLRGSPNDFETWAKITDDPVWGYTSVLKAFKKSENYHGFFFPPGNAHATGGELYVGKEQNSVLKDIFFEASREQNLILRDFNTYYKTGYGPVDVTIKRGHRWGTYEAFIKPILKRKNLSIYRYAKAIQIHLDNAGKAYGVTYVRHGHKRFVRARKEVIVSAGVIESAKLLLLSGIGPKQHLKSIRIPTLRDLPVGKYFQDQVTSGSPSFSIRKGVMFNPRRDLTADDINKYLAKGAGPLATRDFNPAGIVYTSLQDLGDYDYPNLEIIVGPKPTFPSANEEKDSFQAVPILVRPNSFGFIQLSSRNHEDEVKVDPKYLSSDADIGRIVQGLRFAVELVENSAAFTLADATLELDQGVPACDQFIFKSPEYWKCFIQHKNAATYHLFGSCRMGRVGDPKAVVNSRLQVFNTTGLRVVDNSVIPGVISGHTMAAAIMIAEVGSSLILPNRKYKARRRR